MYCMWQKRTALPCQLTRDTGLNVVPLLLGAIHVSEIARCTSSGPPTRELSLVFPSPLPKFLHSCSKHIKLINTNRKWLGTFMRTTDKIRTQLVTDDQTTFGTDRIAFSVFYKNCFGMMGAGGVVSICVQLQQSFNYSWWVRLTIWPRILPVTHNRNVALS